MKNKSWMMAMMVIYGICAVSWIVNCVKDFLVRTPGTVGGWHLALAVIWSAAAVIHLFLWRYQRKKENGKNESKQ